MKERISIGLAKEPVEYEQSAMILTINDPWAALGRSYEYSYAKVCEEDGELYVAKRDDKVIGCLLLEMHSTLKAFIRALCVVQEYRSQGVGAKLLSFVEHRVFRETANVILYTSTERGKRFYERNGYVEIGCLENLNKTGVHEHIMRKTIGPNEEIDFNKLEILVLDGDSPDLSGAIRTAGEEMYKRGLVSKSYAEKCIEREVSFSTGLPTKIPVAIPHTDELYVNRNCLCFQRMASPVEAIELGGVNPLSCRMVINMGLVGQGAQVTMLSKMMELLQDDEFMDVCLHGTKDEVIEKVQSELGSLMI